MQVYSQEQQQQIEQQYQQQIKEDEEKKQKEKQLEIQLTQEQIQDEITAQEIKEQLQYYKKKNEDEYYLMLEQFYQTGAGSRQILEKIRNERYEEIQQKADAECLLQKQRIEQIQQDNEKWEKNYWEELNKQKETQKQQRQNQPFTREWWEDKLKQQEEQDRLEEEEKEKEKEKEKENQKKQEKEKKKQEKINKQKQENENQEQIQQKSSPNKEPSPSQYPQPSISPKQSPQTKQQSLQKQKVKSQLQTQPQYSKRNIILESLLQSLFPNQQQINIVQFIPPSFQQNTHPLPVALSPSQSRILLQQLQQRIQSNQFSNSFLKSVNNYSQQNLQNFNPQPQVPSSQSQYKLGINKQQNKQQLIQEQLESVSLTQTLPASLQQQHLSQSIQQSISQSQFSFTSPSLSRQNQTQSSQLQQQSQTIVLQPSFKQLEPVKKPDSQIDTEIPIFIPESDNSEQQTQQQEKQQILIKEPVEQPRDYPLSPFNKKISFAKLFPLQQQNENQILQKDQEQLDQIQNLGEKENIDLLQTQQQQFSQKPSTADSNSSQTSLQSLSSIFSQTSFKLSKQQQSSEKLKNKPRTSSVSDRLSKNKLEKDKDIIMKEQFEAQERQRRQQLEKSALKAQELLPPGGIPDLLSASISLSLLVSELNFIVNKQNIKIKQIQKELDAAKKIEDIIRKQAQKQVHLQELKSQFFQEHMRQAYGAMVESASEIDIEKVSGINLSDINEAKKKILMGQTNINILKEKRRKQNINKENQENQQEIKKEVEKVIENAIDGDTDINKQQLNEGNAQQVSETSGLENINEEDEGSEDEDFNESNNDINLLIQPAFDNEQQIETKLRLITSGSLLKATDLQRRATIRKMKEIEDKLKREKEEQEMKKQRIRDERERQKLQEKETQLQKDKEILQQREAELQKKIQQFEYTQQATEKQKQQDDVNSNYYNNGSDNLIHRINSKREQNYNNIDSTIASTSSRSYSSGSQTLSRYQLQQRQHSPPYSIYSNPLSSNSTIRGGNKLMSAQTTVTTQQSQQQQQQSSLSLSLSQSQQHPQGPLPFIPPYSLAATLSSSQQQQDEYLNTLDGSSNENTRLDSQYQYNRNTQGTGIQKFNETLKRQRQIINEMNEDEQKNKNKESEKGNENEMKSTNLGVIQSAAVQQSIQQQELPALLNVSTRDRRQAERYEKEKEERKKRRKEQRMKKKQQYMKEYKEREQSDQGSGLGMNDILDDEDDDEEEQSKDEDYEDELIPVKPIPKVKVVRSVVTNPNYSPKKSFSPIFNDSNSQSSSYMKPGSAMSVYSQSSFQSQSQYSQSQYSNTLQNKKMKEQKQLQEMMQQQQKDKGQGIQSFNQEEEEKQKQLVEQMPNQLRLTSVGISSELPQQFSAKIWQPSPKVQQEKQKVKKKQKEKENQIIDEQSTSVSTSSYLSPSRQKKQDQSSLLNGPEVDISIIQEDDDGSSNQFEINQQLANERQNALQKKLIDKNSQIDNSLTKYIKQNEESDEKMKNKNQYRKNNSQYQALRLQNNTTNSILPSLNQSNKQNERIDNTQTQTFQPIPQYNHSILPNLIDNHIGIQNKTPAYKVLQQLEQADIPPAPYPVDTNQYQQQNQNKNDLLSNSINILPSTLVFPQRKTSSSLEKGGSFKLNQTGNPKQNTQRNQLLRRSMSPTPSSQSVHGRKNVTSSGIHITFTNNKRGGNNQTNVIVQLPPILNVGTEEGRQQMIQSVNEVQQAISGVQDNIKDGDIRKMQDKANEAEQRVASVKGPKSMLMTYGLGIKMEKPGESQLQIVTTSDNSINQNIQTWENNIQQNEKK